MKLFLYTFLAIAVICSFSSAEEPMIRAAAISIDITPPIGTPLAGYGGGKRRIFPPDLDPDNYHTFLAPSEGVMEPLSGKVLVFASGAKKVVIVKLDSIGVSQEIVADIAARIEPKTGIGVENIAVTGTHTHSGPGAMKIGPLWTIAAVDVSHPAVYEPFLDKISNAIIEANNQLQPVRVGISTGLNFELSRNRRGHHGIFDPTIGVFKVERMDGTPMALLFNFAVHGTCYGSSNMLFSGDVMGEAEREIERSMAEKKTPVVAMFINGTEGDVSPNGGSSKGAKTVGHGLAKEVMDIAPSISMRNNITIDVANEEIAFDKAHLNIDLSNPDDSRGEIDCWGLQKLLALWKPEDKTFDLKAAQGIADLEPQFGPKLKIEVTGLVSMKFRLQAIRIGDNVIACIPGEPLTQLGVMLKKAGGESGFTNTFVFGLANGHMGYICDEANFDEGGYEAMLTMYGRDSAEKLVAVYSRLFTKLANRK